MARIEFLSCEPTMSKDDTHRSNLIPKQCETCGGSFLARQDRKGRFCSKVCSGTWVGSQTKSPFSRKERERHWQLKARYGLTHEDFTAMWESQNGVCLICETPMVNGGNTRNSAHIDHDHSTGVVRGILCHSCNMGLGKFYDAPEVLEKAASYLRGEL
jgi:hypothetical protein